jgi:hypothetical protein
MSGIQRRTKAIRSRLPKANIYLYFGFNQFYLTYFASYEFDCVFLLQLNSSRQILLYMSSHYVLHNNY